MIDVSGQTRSGMGGYDPAFSLPKDLLCGFPRAVQVVDIAFQGDAFQNVKGAKLVAGAPLSPITIQSVS